MVSPVLDPVRSGAGPVQGVGDGGVLERVGADPLVGQAGTLGDGADGGELGLTCGAARLVPRTRVWWIDPPQRLPLFCSMSAERDILSRFDRLTGRLSVWVPVIISLASLAVAFSGFRLSKLVADRDEAAARVEQASKVTWVFEAGGEHFAVSNQGVKAIYSVYAMLSQEEGGFQHELWIGDLTGCQTVRFPTEVRYKNSGSTLPPYGGTVFFKDAGGRSWKIGRDRLPKSVGSSHASQQNMHPNNLTRIFGGHRKYTKSQACG